MAFKSLAGSRRWAAFAATALLSALLPAACHSDKDAEAAKADKAATQTLKPGDFSARGKPAPPLPAESPAASTPKSSKSRDKGATAQTPGPAREPASGSASTAPPAPESLAAADKPAERHAKPLETVELNAEPQTAGTEDAPGSDGVTGHAGPPPAPEPTAHAVDHPILIDSLVGQINGKPVFASEILDPLDGRLHAMAGQAKSRREWLAAATKEISTELRRRIEDELFISEARASLTPEQRTGLFQFLSQIQQGFVSSQHGSQIAADEALRREGKSLQTAAKDRLDRELIANEVRNRVMPRVSVPWRDVQQEYEREYDKFNPPPIAHLRMIVVSSTNAEGVAGVAADLATGAPFKSVASRLPNEYGRSEGGKLDREFTGPYDSASLVKTNEVNEVARGLSVGQTAGPIEYKDDAGRGRTAWVYLEEIEQRPSRSLYDVQLEIENALKQNRFEVEMVKYMESLKRRGNVSKISDMTEQLVRVAEERYLPPVRK